MLKTAYQRSPKQELAKNTPFFNETDLKHSFIIDFENQEFIHHQAEPLNYLFYLIKGKAKILKTERNGRQSIVQFLTAGDLIGDLTLVQAETITKDVIALGETCCLAVPLAYAETVLKNKVLFLQQLSHYLGKKMLQRVDHFTTNQTYELSYRLAELLLVAANHEDVYKEKHTEIAEYLGVSYRHLIYTFKQFRERGFIQKQGTAYHINRLALHSFVQKMKS
ncbi:transcriptional regulator YeiL [Enterococcus faecalis]|uniref:transcriptional regulator YeiL n=1 Tax=Enterococcus faecalis TaxID=1351 RepID=UPI0015604556|nr:cyclic nucleotide-binding protein [Enterococcus faecalis]